MPSARAASQRGQGRLVSELRLRRRGQIATGGPVAQGDRGQGEGRKEDQTDGGAGEEEGRGDYGSQEQGGTEQQMGEMWGK